jgi:response regulator RpfG family c-di-GMP phosphodiesterase
LCVDDEPRVLDGLRLVLGRRYELFTANSGDEGLGILDAEGPFEAVVSDMRMPKMNGATFLAEVRNRSEDTVRLLLTGGTDMESAIKAVNEGQIFRFLTKPTDREDLISAIDSAVELHRLKSAEKVLLEQTLRGSIQALTDVLGLASPVAFGRAGRIKRRVADMAAHMGVEEGWQVEVAAMLSQIGYITLPAGTAEKVFEGRALDSEEREALAKVSSVPAKVLGNIPRLEPVLEILNRVQDPAGPDGAKGPPMGSRLIRVASDYDLMEAEGHSSEVAIESMRRQAGVYDAQVLAALAEVTQSDGSGKAVESVSVADLKPGMILAEDVFMETGVLFVARGYEVTESFVELAQSLDPTVVGETVRVLTE